MLTVFLRSKIMFPLLYYIFYFSSQDFSHGEVVRQIDLPILKSAHEKAFTLKMPSGVMLMIQNK